MTLNGLFGILTGGAIVALAANSYEADAAGVMGSGSMHGMLLILGLGLVWLGMWGRKKIFQGAPSDGRFLALGMREVNIRGASLYYGQKGKEGEHE